ncbi:type II 3-dehydroquinate dehydratase [Desulfonatronovibrio magnus]|uniref:type II 3-dehydroquinate dehydratase n=1 Tax=Desulfonatronovibrio magnus TaxID=698827 RepID=UPI000AEC17E5|nr:type II 3-dehydroquinate dehydratase [Desulfonatronovibrio magnus]
MNNKKKYSILTVNGPNLKYLGKRNVDIYGSKSMDDLPSLLDKHGQNVLQKAELDFFQANSEGDIIDRIELAWQDKISGIVINPGAYTHTSLALADCLAWINIPYVEVHLSNIWSRDKIRQHSLTARHSMGVVAGFGIMSYVYGLQAVVDYLDINISLEGK